MGLRFDNLTVIENFMKKRPAMAGLNTDGEVIWSYWWPMARWVDGKVIVYPLPEGVSQTTRRHWLLLRRLLGVRGLT